ncbi:MAG: 2OG-Fe(II) oxygenase, partial [Kordiimonadaceae bacterium]|nr:2OG-Fe(II) oxygenase [Kordiimonadaceae bacterium]
EKTLQKDIALWFADAGFTDSWKNWVKTNVAAGCDKDGMFKILVDNGFEFGIAEYVLGHVPSQPLDQISNPLKIAEEQAARLNQQRANSPKVGPRMIPTAQKLPRDDIEFYTVDDFLAEGECKTLIALIKADLRPSTLTQEESDEYFRTSSTCNLGLNKHPLVADLDRRMCSMLGLDPTCAEVMQGQHYEVGQEFKAHTDSFEKPDSTHMTEHLGQRCYTFTLYLNDVEKGGQTKFPLLDQSIQPKRGTAIIWNSLRPDGSLNPLSLHQGMPIIKGEKTIITKWFRTRGGLPVDVREANEDVANFTKTGFKQARLAAPLFKKIQKFYAAKRDTEVIETVKGGYIKSVVGKTASHLVDLPAELRAEIHAAVITKFQKWANCDLEPTFVYGIRVYKHGATLQMHRDAVGSHTFGAIINVAQDVNEEWLLQIDDNKYRRHQLALKPGDLFLYEGGRLEHGRTTPLNGTSYANIFCHFKPLDK